MPEDNGGRAEETGFYTFVRSRREVRANAARRLNTAKATETARPLKDRRKAELQDMADGLGLEVKGTGSGGSVIKADLLKALKRAEPKATGGGSAAAGPNTAAAGTTGTTTDGTPAPNTATT